tara:strand:+ start:71 stop:739 length:669 start_codon:yes stop_codon:yes gene_type:complete
MNKNQWEENRPKFLLAIHSSSETFGVAVADANRPSRAPNSSIFPIGRELSNKVFTCLEEVFPAKNWKNISRLSVATGPGGFTSTRISIAIGRIISEQIRCPLDGFNSFILMAKRLHYSLEPKDKNKPFWIVKDLPRRGKIAGKYQVIHKNEKEYESKVIELEKPQLLESCIHKPVLGAKEDVSKDVLELLHLSKERYEKNIASSWKDILPIYPTSPVKIFNE